MYPSYDYAMGADGANDREGENASDDDGTSPHGGPLGCLPLRQKSQSGESSPGRQSTWKAGLGDSTFTFSFDTWRPGPQPIPDPQPLSVPNRRAMDASIDSVSASEKWDTPGADSRSTQAERTPSMGNKLDLDLKRSERNMRYNALHQEQATQQQQQSSSPVRMHARFIFGGSSGDMDPNEAQYFPDYSSAYAASQESTPDKSVHPNASRPFDSRVGSEDSMTMSLRSASDNMDKLRALLGEADTKNTGRRDEEEAIVDAFVTASSPSPRRSKLPVSKKGRNMRSDSPSPEKRTPRPLPATPEQGPTKFSPTFARDNGSPNRFIVLDVETTVYDETPSPKTKPFDGVNDEQYGDENRVASDDTLDRTLEMLSSPDDGYDGDESTGVVSSPAERQVPKRYRSQNKKGGKKVLGEVSGNMR